MCFTWFNAILNAVNDLGYQSCNYHSSQVTLYANNLQNKFDISGKDLRMPR